MKILNMKMLISVRESCIKSRDREKEIEKKRRKRHGNVGQFCPNELHLAEEFQATESALSPSDLKYELNTIAMSCTVAIIHVMRSNHQNHLRDTERARFARFTFVRRLSRLGRGRWRQAYGCMIIDQRLEHFRRERDSPKFPTLGVLCLSYHLAQGVFVAIYVFRHLYSIPVACSPSANFSFTDYFTLN